MNRTAAADVWYFAYGSNLSLQRMQQRTGPIVAPRLARLKDFRVAFNVTDTFGEEHYANIVPATGSVVWGVAYWCSPLAMAELDRYEGVAAGCYSRERLEVETGEGERLQVEVYIGGERFAVAEGRPSDWYLEIILAGAKEHALPADYVRGIEALGKRTGS